MRPARTNHYCQFWRKGLGARFLALLTATYATLALGPCVEHAALIHTAWDCPRVMLKCIAGATVIESEQNLLGSQK